MDLESVHIQRFRCFDDFKITGFRQITLVAGANNVGKTALLEAIFLLYGPASPDLPGMLNLNRQLSGHVIVPLEFWGWLFHERNIKETATIQSSGDASTERSLTLTLKHGDTLSMSDKDLIAQPPGPILNPYILEMAYQIGSGERFISRARPGDQGIQYDVASIPSIPTILTMSSTLRYPLDVPQLFTDAVRDGQKDKLIAAMRTIAPDCNDLLLLQWCGASVLHVGRSSGVPMPIQLMGDGVARLFSILLVVYRAKDGIVLIDEIEAGFHHSNFCMVWESVIDTATKNNVQVVATTHSLEFIESGYSVFRKGERSDLLRLIRLQSVDGKTKAFDYDLDLLEAAREIEAEVR
jgi:hypothetical protein